MRPNSFDVLYVEYKPGRVQYVQASHTPYCEDRTLQLSMYDANDDILKILSESTPMDDTEFSFYCEYDWSKEREAKKKALLSSRK